MTLSAIATLLVEHFLPECRKTYLFNNYRQSNVYRTYKDIVPEYLQDRPRNVILHCLDRQATSMKYDEHNIVDVDPNSGEFKVTKDSKKERTVTFGHGSIDSMPSCSCLDWKKFHLPCKHFFAIFRLRQSWTWKKLPKAYLESPYLTLDNKALKDYYQEPELSTDRNEDCCTNGESSVDLIENLQEQIPYKKVFNILNVLTVEGIALCIVLIQELSAFQQAQKVRVTLKMIETLTYSCQVPEQLAALNTKLEDIFSEMKASIDQSEGLVIRPAITRRAKQISQKYRSKLSLINHKYSALPGRKKRGRRKQSALFRNRVGQKAHRLRKVITYSE